MLDARLKAEMPIWIAVAMKGILHDTYGEAVVVTPEEIHNWLYEHLGLELGGSAIKAYMQINHNRYRKVQETFGQRFMLFDELPVQLESDRITLEHQKKLVQEWWDSKPEGIGND